MLENPIPAPSETGQPEKNNTRNNEQISTKKDHSSKDFSTIINKPIPVTIGEQQEKTTEQHKNKSSSNYCIWDSINWNIVFNGIIGFSTVGLWIGAICTLRHNRRVFNETHRPWITIKDISVRKPINTNSPEFSLIYDLRNVGHTPAHVFIYAEIVISNGRSTKTERNYWLRRQKEICSKANGIIRNNGWDDAPWSIFPSDKFDYNGDIVKPAVSGVDEYHPRLIGCVLYRGAPTGSVFQTPFWAWISKEPKDSGSPRSYMVAFTANDTQIPENEMAVKGLCITGNTT